MQDVEVSSTMLRNLDFALSALISYECFQGRWNICFYIFKRQLQVAWNAFELQKKQGDKDYCQSSRCNRLLRMELEYKSENKVWKVFLCVCICFGHSIQPTAHSSANTYHICEQAIFYLLEHKNKEKLYQYSFTNYKLSFL